MPGFMLIAQCPCGFDSEVWPGSSLIGKESVIAYDPERPGLLTVDSEEAETGGLITIPDPFLSLSNRSMADPEVQRLGQEAKFDCPTCQEPSMYFRHVGFWD
jgi:hypothetical protein